jgi:hypothetical protein
MQIDTYFFVVWAHRSAKSIFGAASNPVMLDGAFLCFKTEEKARAASDRFNARSGGSHVHYSVRPVRVQMKRPSGLAKGESDEPRYAMPLSMPPTRSRRASRSRMYGEWWARLGSNQ